MNIVAVTPARRVSFWMTCALSLLGIGSASCGPDADSGGPAKATADEVRPSTNAADPSAAPLPSDSASAGSLPSLCARGQDSVTDVFCSAVPARISSLSDLQYVLNVKTDLEEAAATSIIRTVGTALGHSTALDGQLVSPINPRVILPGGGNYTLMAFQRGVQRVEIVSRDRDDSQFNFYLVTFRQACNDLASGCTPGDLYTPRVERNWLEVQLQDDEDLKNTPLDCRQCHQRASATPALLMRELDAPWTHYFANQAEAGGVPGPTGGDLAMDYVRAKGQEPYAGVSAESMLNTTGYALEFIVQVPQPLLFDAPKIRDELWRYDSQGRLLTPQRSETWDRAFAAWKRGEQLPLPYFEPRATDLSKQQHLSDVYLRYASGELDAAELPDLAEIFPDDPQIRAEIGLQVEPDALPATLLIEACGSCHNDVLDQTLTRARFNVAVDRLSAAELAVAMDRVQRGVDTPGVMPPKGARQLDAGGRDRLVAYLERAEFPAADRALLERAAALGMAGTLPP